MASRDLYEILGVSRTAGKEEIKKRYKKLARQLHPDVNPGDKDAERRFKEINAAHAVLSDDEKRKLYDEFGDLALQSGFDAARAQQLREAMRAGRAPAGAPGGFEGFDWTEAVGGGAGVDFEDLFGDIFSGLGGRGRGRRRQRPPSPGEDIEAELELDFLTAVKGGQTRLTLEGAGTSRETVDVTVPPGVRDGQRLRLAGLGAPGEPGAPAGDLYVRIHVREHRVFEREGDDLLADVPITIPEAINGATVSFPTPFGEVSLKVPPGTQSGRRFRLRGMGVPTRGGGRGDLIARAVVQVPDKDGPEVRELAQKLGRFYSRDPRSEIRL